MEAAKLWDPDELLAGPGIVDYVVGAAPGPGVFVLGTIEHPRQRHYLNLYKLGEGPIYCFYTPYHLCHFEVPTTIARAALLGDATIAPIAGPLVEVVTLAKRDLKAGETIDELGGYTVYGEAETAAATARGGLLPIGVAVGAKLRRDLPKDAVLTYADVEIPEGRLVDRLRREQDAMFGLERAPRPERRGLGAEWRAGSPGASPNAILPVHTPGGGGYPVRAKVNLSIDDAVTREARALGVNMSRVAEAAIAEAARLERNRRWREENRAALAAYAREIERDGLPLARFRSF